MNQSSPKALLGVTLSSCQEQTKTLDTELMLAVSSGPRENSFTPSLQQVP